MKKAELKVIVFEASDVIATSGLVMFGTSDTTPNNITFDGKTGNDFYNAYATTLFYRTSNDCQFGLTLHGADSFSYSMDYDGYYAKYPEKINGYTVYVRQ